MTITLNTALRNKIIDAICPSLTVLDIYTGAPPATPDMPPSGTLLATFPVAFPAAVGGVAWLEVPVAAVGLASGVAGWGRWRDGGVEPLALDGLCGTAGTPFVLSSTTVVDTAPITLISLRLTQPVS